jgi:hypothetical protein
MRAIANSLMLSLMLAVTAAGQQLPDAPQPVSTKKLIALNAIQVGGTVIAATGARWGARQCIGEGDRRFIGAQPKHTPGGEFGKAAAIGAAFDIVAGFASWKLRRSHPSIAAAIPVLSAGAQGGIGTFSFMQGCY